MGVGIELDGHEMRGIDEFCRFGWLSAAAAANPYPTKAFDMTLLAWLRMPNKINVIGRE